MPFVFYCEKKNSSFKKVHLNTWMGWQLSTNGGAGKKKWSVVLVLPFGGCLQHSCCVTDLTLWAPGFPISRMRDWGGHRLLGFQLWHPVGRLLFKAFCSKAGPVYRVSGLWNTAVWERKIPSSQLAAGPQSCSLWSNKLCAGSQIMPDCLRFCKWLFQEWFPLPESGC